MSETEPNEAVASINSLVLEHLRAIRATQSEHSEALNAIRVELAALGQQLGGLTASVYSGKSEIEDVKRRVERLEHRLELRDSA